ncbi:hypothetical protein ACO0LM_25110 [Undibacterium sp. Di26W]|uniref:hypothetical protein n=1 Tax=Undibacterium sp. Di26W TaxID=3413035 RepID=UPI003BF18CAD
MISMIYELKNKYGISITEGENFKQAMYNGRLTDSEEQLREKIELGAKHYPGKDLLIGTYESDETSPALFAYAVIIPVHG